MAGLRGTVVLADYATEDLPALHRPVQRYDDQAVMIRRPLLSGLVGPVPVVVLYVGPQHGAQMGLVVDQHPVSALGSCCPYPAFGITIRPGRLRRWFDHPHILTGE